MGQRLGLIPHASRIDAFLSGEACQDVTLAVHLSVE